MLQMKIEDRNFIPKGYRTVVGVSHLNTPTDFYVIELSDWGTVLNLSLKLESYSDTSDKPTVLKKDDLCMAYCEDKYWCRARVTKVLGPYSRTTCGSDEVEIMYIDVGNTDTFAVDRLRFLPAEFADAPSIAHHCSLFNIHPPANTWTHRGIHAFWKMIFEEKLLMYVMGYELDMYIVDLGELDPTVFRKVVPISAREALIFCGHACFTPSSGPLAHQPLKVLNQFLYNTFNKGRTFAVYLGHLDTPSDFYVYQIEDDLFTLNEEINLECNSTQTKCMEYMPQIGTACAAVYSLDNCWYRAKVMAVSSGELVEVFYVDYGNRELVKWKTLKMLQKKFLRLTAQGIRCTLTGVVPCNGSTWPSKSKDFLEQTLGDNRLSITINEIEREKHSVTLFKSLPENNLNINEMLVMQGFANSVGHRTVKNDKYLKLRRTFEALGILAPGTSVYSREHGKNTANSSRTILEEDTKMYYCGQDTFASQAGHKALEQQQSNLRYSEFKIPNLQFWTVTVPTIFSPTSVFIQLCHMENGILQDRSKQFEQLSTIMQIQAPSQPLLTEHRIGQVCCTRYSQNDVWYRAIILGVYKYAVKVKYVDYGNGENQPLDMVHQLKPEWCELPIQGMAVKFWNIEAVENAIYDEKFYGDLVYCLNRRNVAQIKVWGPEVQVEFVEENNSKHLAYQQLLDSGLLRMMPGK